MSEEPMKGPGPDVPTTVTIEAKPEVWRAIVQVLMEAPVPGKFVAPLTQMIEQHMRAQGHSI